MSTPARRSASPGLDVRVALVTTVIAVAWSFGHEGAALGVAGQVISGILAAAGGLVVVFRRRDPSAVLAVVVGTCLAHLALVDSQPRASVPALIVAVYTVGAQLPRGESQRRVLLAIGLVDAALVLRVPFSGVTPLGEIPFFTIAAAGAWAVGDNLGTRRAYLAGLVERTERLEREQAVRAERAVLEERARIARELHDVVAHHVSAIAVTAAAAEEVAESDPGRARAALATISETSRRALGEMRALVGVLRAGEDGGVTAPQPSLQQVERLVTQARATGLQVRLHVEGEPRPLPDAVELSAYRIVQEALTNTLRHAHASLAEVTVRYEPAAVEVTVEDDGGGVAGREPAPGAGRGLVGMRERVAIFSGTLDVGRRPQGGFRVRAHLPVAEAPV